MRSNGGEMTLDAAVAAPIQIAVSGPTGGVIAAKHTARLLGLPNLVTLDMGGTSTDVSTVVDGKEKFTTDFEIEWGRPIQIPMIDIRTIGAGGGSIARIDSGGMLVVGPESAGANPGPACYGNGGDKPTVTDANVVLGRISATNFLGGDMSLDAEAARKVIEPIARLLDYTVEQAALAIVRIANNNMVGALHTVLTEQGLDPRDFVLVAFGGAGPPHMCDLMTEASIPKGLVPNFPGQFSAFGFTMADARVDRYRTVQLNSRFFDRARAASAMAALVAETRAELAAQGHHDVTISRSVEMRYLGQNYELEIPIDIDTFSDAEVAGLFDAFHAQHEARFGFRLDDHMEIVNFLITGIARTGEMDHPEIAAADGDAVAVSTRPVWFDTGWVETPVYRPRRTQKRPCDPRPGAGRGERLGDGAGPRQIPDRRSLRQPADFRLKLTEQPHGHGFTQHRQRHPGFHLPGHGRDADANVLFDDIFGIARFHLWPRAAERRTDRDR